MLLDNSGQFLATSREKIPYGGSHCHNYEFHMGRVGMWHAYPSFGMKSTFRGGNLKKN